MFKMNDMIYWEQNMKKKKRKKEGTHVLKNNSVKKAQLDNLFDSKCIGNFSGEEKHISVSTDQATY